jgi:putative acetyltransferase
MSEPIVLRPERPDHPQVVALLAGLDAYLGALYPPEANHILDVEALRDPAVDFIAAWSGANLLGCGATRCMPAEPASGGRPYGEVKRMMVRPDARGRRIGALLLAELEARLRRRGVGLALLETGRDQAEAVRLYERAGYARWSPFAGYPDNGLSLFFAKELSA